MCGIAGLVSHRPIYHEDVDCVQRMQATLIHRGPDGEGFFRDKRYAGAMRRLSIIDIERSGQPLVDGDLVLFFNGEIYNYRELRAQLAHKGAVFKTSGDGECILHLYRRHGTAFVTRLRGMFAIALWDRSTEKLILARDRFGEKPLYIAEKDGQLLFASEMKSMVASGRVNLDLSAAALNQYFHLNFVVDPLTMLEDVRKLPPAHVLELDARTWTRREWRYWDLAAAEPCDDYSPELILDRLHEAVQFNMRSDRPVAIALSGGLDSSAIASVTARYSSRDVTAISVGYPASEREASVSDERDQARELAGLLGLPFHDVEISREEVVAHYPEHILAMDDPIADISSFGYAAVSRKAHELGIPVLLFGMGGDELLAGYPWTLAAIHGMARINRWRSRGIDPRNYSAEGSCASARDAYFAEWTAWQADPDIAPLWRYSLDFRRADEKLNNWLSPGFHIRLNSAPADALPDRLARIGGGDDKPAVLTAKYMSETYLVGNGIPQADRLGMHHSVEARQPLLDHRFAEAVIGALKRKPDLPAEGKAFWRTILAQELPGSVLNRPKRGFRPPAVEWFQALAKAHSGVIGDGVLSAQDIFTPEAIDAMMSARPEPKIAMPFYFKALVLSLWFEGMAAIAGASANSGRTGPVNTRTDTRASAAN